MAGCNELLLVNIRNNSWSISRSSEWLEICLYEDFGQCSFIKIIILVLRKRSCIHCIFDRVDRVEGELLLFNRYIQLVIFLSALLPLFSFMLFSLCKEKKESVSRFGTLQPCFLSFNREHTELCMTTVLKMKMKFPSGMVIISSTCNRLMMDGCMVLFRELGKQECFQQIILSLLTDFSL